MKLFIALILLISVTSFAGDTDSTQIVNVYVKSPELTSNDYEIVFDETQNDSVRKLNKPRLMNVAFYTPNYKGFEFIIINKSHLVSDYDEFYARFQITCDMFKSKFKTAPSGSMCMIYHEELTDNTLKSLNFRDKSVNQFSEVTGCVGNPNCKIRALN